MTTFASAGGAQAGFAGRLCAAGVVPVAEVEDAGRAVALAQALEAGSDAELRSYIDLLHRIQDRLGSPK
jgi:hypothetical protein